jgi:hypothetical protein
MKYSQRVINKKHRVKLAKNKEKAQADKTSTPKTK